MDSNEILSMLARMKPHPDDRPSVMRLYAETLADVADRITEEELRRLLLCGAYLSLAQSEREVNDDVPGPSFWRGNRNLN